VASRRILVVKRDKIGDMLLTTPLLGHLRGELPDVRIDVVCTDYNAWVLDGNRDIDRRIVFPRLRVGRTVRPRKVPENAALYARLALSRYDAVIVAQGEESHRAIRRGLVPRAGRVIAYAADPGRYGARLTDALPVPADDVHEVDRMLALAERLGLPPPRSAQYPRYVLPESARRFALAWLAERGLEPGRFVVLGLGARRPDRQPSAAQVARWTAWWRERFGLATVFVWTPGGSDNPMYPGDDGIAEPVLRMNLPGLHPYRGPIIETLGLVWHARTTVFPDSGLMHFAAASPGGVVGLFARPGLGPPPTRWGPRGPRAHVVQAATDIPSEPDDSVLEKVGALVRDRETAAVAS
jgi:ADP-heptose:LPS heptosyltransferase